MRKGKAFNYCLIGLIIIILFNINFNNGAKGEGTSSLMYQDDKSSEDITELSNKLVRFHCIANSDSNEDQSVKLKVRDAILKGLGEPLEKCKTREDSLKFLESKKQYIESIADNILKENGMNYRSKAMLGEFNFPIKSYGKITLPSGKYTALRVVLGNGDGRNWWCVMFPPLCFIDITRGLTSEETDKSLGKVLGKNEVAKITTSAKVDAKVNKKQNKPIKPKVEIRFKGIEIIKNIFSK